MAALPLKSIPLAPLLHSISFSRTPKAPISGYALSAQTIDGRVDITIQVQSQVFANLTHAGNTEEKRIIHVDLANSEFGPGRKMMDQNDFRGYYVQSIEYKIWLGTRSGLADWSTPLPHWSIVKESPDTTNLTGSVSSSISWGFNASTGSFGDIATGGVGGNIGVSSTHSHSLTDFTFLQSSTAQVLDHRVALSLCKDGSPYDNYGSLIDPWQNPFLGAQLRPLPDLAKSNVPLIGQAVWMNEDDAGLVNDLRVHVWVNPTWQLVEGWAAVKVDAKNTAITGWQPFYADIDFALLK
ncbi:MAG: hypothetical protein ACREFN_19035 [Acetobacteraceae bacterium]